MWITAFFERKHSLSTCGQTVCNSCRVIHIRFSEFHLFLGAAFAAERLFAII